MGTYSKLSKLNRPRSEERATPPLAATSPHSDTQTTAQDEQEKKQKEEAKSQKEPKEKHARMHASKHVNMHTYMHAFLDQKATYSYAFRYPPELLEEKLEEALLRVKRKHKVKLPKNAIAVAAMAFLLWDFEANGKNSVLYKMLVKKPK